MYYDTIIISDQICSIQYHTVCFVAGVPFLAVIAAVDQHVHGMSCSSRSEARRAECHATYYALPWSAAALCLWLMAWPFAREFIYSKHVNITTAPTLIRNPTIVPTMRELLYLP